MNQNGLCSYRYGHLPSLFRSRVQGPTTPSAATSKAGNRFATEPSARPYDRALCQSYGPERNGESYPDQFPVPLCAREMLLERRCTCLGSNNDVPWLSKVNARQGRSMFAFTFVCFGAFDHRHQALFFFFWSQKYSYSSDTIS